MDHATDEPVRCVLAVDPGSVKCGVAVVDERGETLLQAVVSTQGVIAEIVELIARFAPIALVIGGGTGSKGLLRALREVGLPLDPITVDEAHTTEAARARWLSENPPTGLRRLLPRSLRLPTVPYDDYVAVILAERYLAAAAQQGNAKD